ncbi:MAG TPA: hypothetical protein VJM33_05080 [Microthrixaceae bacterium]|nr:hypothetical protein [Microthrixaceae bacterium]
MRPLRLVLFILAAVCLVVTFFLATSDVFEEDRNCGAALWPKDTSRIAQETGDIADDDFNAEVLRKQCSQKLLEQRLATAAALAVSIVLVILALRARTREERFPGDPIV